jgi:hypothetical protein
MMRPRHLGLRGPSWLLATLLLGAATLLQPGLALDQLPQDGEALAEELRESVPPGEVDVQGMIRIRAGDGRRHSLPFHYQVLLTADGWQSIYETSGGGMTTPQRLTVVRRPGQPNQYLLETIAPGDGERVVTTLTGDEAMVPFAGSDFWLADLGLEFLHWPHHEIRRDLRITRRKGRPCQILESRTDTPSPGGYSRVVSWIDRETRQPIIAEAYGADGKRFKEFEVGGVTKVDGVWEIKNLEMRNLRSDSRSVLEFSYRQRE